MTTKMASAYQAQHITTIQLVSHTSQSLQLRIPKTNQNKTSSTQCHATASRPPSPPPTIQSVVSTLPAWSAGPYSLLLQLAHPSLAQAVLSHSRFTTHGLSRLRRTAAYILALTHGTPRQQSAILSLVNKHHSFVRKGTLYTARDPALQKWTAAAMFAGQVRAHEAIYGGTALQWSGEEKERLCLACGVFASALDMPEGEWFESLDEFERYVEDEMGSMQPSEVSRQAGRAFLWDMELPFWLGWWMMPVVRLFMAFWLPGRWRKAWGLADPNNPGNWWMGWVYGGLIWMVWVVDVWVMPGWIKSWLFGLMLSDMQWAADEIERTGRWPV